MIATQAGVLELREILASNFDSAVVRSNFATTTTSTSNPKGSVESMKFLGSILILFVLNCLFCWLLTSDMGFGPTLYLISFFGGIFLISVVGVATLEIFHDQQ